MKTEQENGIVNTTPTPIVYIKSGGTGFSVTTSDKKLIPIDQSIVPGEDGILERYNLKFRYCNNYARDGFGFGENDDYINEPFLYLPIPQIDEGLDILTGINSDFPHNDTLFEIDISRNGSEYLMSINNSENIVNYIVSNPLIPKSLN